MNCKKHPENAGFILLTNGTGRYCQVCVVEALAKLLKVENLAKKKK